MGFQYPVLTVLIPICPTEVRPYLEEWGQAGPKRIFGRWLMGVRRGLNMGEGRGHPEDRGVMGKGDQIRTEHDIYVLTFKH